MGFGVSNTKNEKTTVYNIFGPLAQQNLRSISRPDLGFDDEKRLRELSTHEFGHSFVNSVVDKMPQELIEKTSGLFEPIESAMADQGYPAWRYSLNEHFVRAGEVLIARSLGNTADAAQMQAHYIEDRKFIYLPVIIKWLERYEADKKMTYEEAVKKALEELSSMAAKL